MGGVRVEDEAGIFVGYMDAATARGLIASGDADFCRTGGRGVRAKRRRAEAACDPNWWLGAGCRGRLFRLSKRGAISYFRLGQSHVYERAAEYVCWRQLTKGCRPRLRV